MKVRALVLTGDGLNCEAETAKGFEMVGAIPSILHLGEVLERPKLLGDFQILALVGGFSHGDHLGAGNVLAQRLGLYLGEALEDFIQAGKPLIGICNGFQALVRLGVLPGLDTGEGAIGEPCASLMVNASGKFEDRWVDLKVQSDSGCLWTQGLKNLYLPVRHGEGRFVVKDDETWDQILSSKQIVLRYDSLNPNGSLGDVAGLTNSKGNILGLMPHPEGYLYAWHHPLWFRRKESSREIAETGQGLRLFENAVKAMI
jgi:phosphoribosylformylglycinamidine synthase subunit PurQ / glutaminase